MKTTPHATQQCRIAYTKARDFTIKHVIRMMSKGQAVGLESTLYQKLLSRLSYCRIKLYTRIITIRMGIRTNHDFATCQFRTLVISFAHTEDPATSVRVGK